MNLKLFFDLVSQPSRALYILFKVNKIPFEAKLVALRKGEHLKDDFKNLSRFQKVPFINEDTFQLNESVAILRYVFNKYNIDNHWYPKNLQQQAKIDEYLEWQHLNTRMHCAQYFQKSYAIPMKTQKPPNKDVIEKSEEDMANCFKAIETLFLQKNQFLCGDKISAADVFAACEIEQPRVSGFEPKDGRPVLKEWLERVRNESNPFYDEAHLIINKMAKKKL